MCARKTNTSQERMGVEDLAKKPARSTSRKRNSSCASTSLSEIPRGIEVLVKKASVDPEFKELLIERRAEAAREIDLKLDPAEHLILTSVPKDHLEAIISRTKVRWKDRAIFLGRAAAVMLTALGTVTLNTSCGTKGNDTDRDYVAKREAEAPADDESGLDSET